jgi:hypothetical protein
VGTPSVAQLGQPQVAVRFDPPHALQPAAAIASAARDFQHRDLTTSLLMGLRAAARRDTRQTRPSRQTCAATKAQAASSLRYWGSDRTDIGYRLGIQYRNARLGTARIKLPSHDPGQTFLPYYTRSGSKQEQICSVEHGAAVGP